MSCRYIWASGASGAGTYTLSPHRPLFNLAAQVAECIGSTARRHVASAGSFKRKQCDLIGFVMTCLEADLAQRANARSCHCKVTSAESNSNSLSIQLVCSASGKRRCCGHSLGSHPAWIEARPADSLVTGSRYRGHTHRTIECHPFCGSRSLATRKLTHEGKGGR